jgi:hypothetical protein
MVASTMLATTALAARSTALAAPLQTRIGAAPPTRIAAAPPTASTSAPPTALVDLRGPSDLRAAFNNDRGRLRIILLLSPT